MAASLALPIALFIYLGTTSWVSNAETADREIERTLDVIHEHALKVFETIERTLSEVNEIIRGDSDEDIKAQALMLHGRLARLSTTLPQVNSLWIFDATGDVLVNSIAPLPSPANFLDRDYFKAHLERDAGLYIGKLLSPRDPYNGAPFFGISRRRESDNAAFIGVIEASVRPSYFTSFYTRTARDSGSFIVLGRADGAVLARHPSLPPSAAAKAMKAAAPISAERFTTPATVISADDGVERRIAYQRVEGHPIYVAAGMETSAIRARWLHVMGGYMLFGLPAMTLLFLALSLAMRRTRHLHDIAAKQREADEAMKHSRRLEALGQLTGGVAHDFNNLLTVIRSSVELLERPNVTTERRARYVSAISQTVDRAAKLTSQLLAFARRQTLKPEVFDVGQSVRSVSSIIGTLGGSPIHITLQLADEPCYIDADASQFETALINIAVNARDAMNGEGTLKIRVSPATTTPPSLPPNRLGYVAVAVTDSGKGIPSELLEYIFEPFFTTKGVGHGTGLGLSQVFGFTKQSGGEVVVDSKVGQGSTFTLYLPRVSGGERNSGSPAVDNVAAEGHGMTVLVVEDNPSVGEFATDALIERGYVTTLVSDPDSALAELDRNADGIDVVFSDVVMPGMDGIQLAREIERRYPGVPVVLTSGYSHVLAKNGMSGFNLLHKPYSIDQLSHTLNRTGQTRRAKRFGHSAAAL